MALANAVYTANTLMDTRPINLSSAEGGCAYGVTLPSRRCPPNCLATLHSSTASSPAVFRMLL